MCNQHGSPDVETWTVGARLMYFMSVFAHFTIFPLGDFLHIFTEIAASTILLLGNYTWVTWVSCWLVLHGPLDLCGEPPASGHPDLLMLACPVSNKQDEWTHIALLSVLGIGYF